MAKKRRRKKRQNTSLLSVAIAAALVLKHRANIARLVAGTEKKLGSRTERVDR